MQQTTIPAFLNSKAGTADDAKKILEESGHFEVHSVEPDKLKSSIQAEVDKGAKRILISGGDGSVATAASVVVNSDVELAVLPGGTLNHFAKDNGIPTDLKEAVQVAVNGTTRKVDVGFVHERIFLNTSSIGAYVTFVRVRERFEKTFGYRIASALAFIRIMTRLRPVGVKVEVDGKMNTYRSPVVFVGVGQRELKMPSLGSRVTGGERGLQVIVVSGSSAARVLALAFAAVARGTRSASRTPDMDSFIVEKFSIELRHASANVAVDGEIVVMETPLEYRIAREALTVVVPSDSPLQQDNQG
ncbi:MAG: diacylglycerol kinase [Gemmatimonadaceae bacterium]|nr:diacylglycerol kinase [Gemmatimonadaceae bacterium]